MNWHKDKLNEILVSSQAKLIDVLPGMENSGLQVLMIIDDQRRILGIITDGDIRRALLQGKGLDMPVTEVMNPHPKALVQKPSIKEEAKKLMLKHSIRHVPVVDNFQRVEGIILWIDLFDKSIMPKNHNVVIMAGGKGTRLDPFTKILPKPMIPLGDKPIIEVIMDKFYEQGFSNFILSLGYKAEIIKLYFNENNGRPYKVNFIQEDKPLGTAGSLGLLKNKEAQSFILTNCDIIVEADYDEVLRYHKEKSFDLTIVGALRNFTIPYGVLKMNEESFTAIEEKPKFHFLVNTGVYVIEPGIIDILSENEYLDMTDLITKAQNNGLKVGVYPYHGQWFDIGQWEEYRQTIKAFEVAG